MSALDLASLAVGDRVQHELMVRNREDKVTKNGDPFAVLQLGNASGQISANVWKEQLPFLEGVKAGSVVQVIGAVESYQGRRQLKITAPLRVVAACRGEPRRVPAARWRRHRQAVGDGGQVAPRHAVADSCARRWTCSSPTMSFARGSSARPARRAGTTRRSAGC